MTDDKIPALSPGEDGQTPSGSRWEAANPTPDDSAGPAPYVSASLTYEPSDAPAPDAPRSGRKRLAGIGAAAAVAGLLVGGLGGFAVGTLNGPDRGSDVAFNHEGFGDHDGDHGGFPPPGGDQREHAPSTGGDDGSDT